jgi:hypothetical protein
MLDLPTIPNDASFNLSVFKTSEGIGLQPSH